MKSYQEWKQKDITLFHKRKEGAHKIATEAKTKGGPAQLTAWHFAAKNPEYQKCLSILQQSNPQNTILSKYKSLLGKLNNIDDMSQQQFQELIGQTEVYGEVFVQLNKPCDY